MSYLCLYIYLYISIIYLSRLRRGRGSLPLRRRCRAGTRRPCPPPSPLEYLQVLYFREHVKVISQNGCLIRKQARNPGNKLKWEWDSKSIMWTSRRIDREREGKAYYYQSFNLTLNQSIKLSINLLNK